MPLDGVTLAFSHRAEMAPFEQRPLWLTTRLSAMETLVSAVRLKRAGDMDKWTSWQSALVRWLETAD